MEIYCTYDPKPLTATILYAYAEGTRDCLTSWLSACLGWEELVECLSDYVCLCAGAGEVTGGRKADSELVVVMAKLPKRSQS